MTPDRRGCAGGLQGAICLTHGLVGQTNGPLQPPCSPPAHPLLSSVLRGTLDRGGLQVATPLGQGHGRNNLGPTSVPEKCPRKNVRGPRGPAWDACVRGKIFAEGVCVRGKMSAGPGVPRGTLVSAEKSLRNESVSAEKCPRNENEFA